MADDSMLTGYLAGQADNNGNNNGWGSDGGWLWILVIFALLGFGGNGWGNWGGNNGGQGALTRADMCSEFNFNNLENGVRGISQGICDSTFALNNTIVNGFNGIQRDMCTGFAGINAGINATQVAMMQGFNAAQAQAAQCLKKISKKVKGIFCIDNFNAVGTCAA